MSANLAPEALLADKLLAVAADWRERADSTTDPHLWEAMRYAAEELERMAVEAKGETPNRA
jgi:hypothetical protein